MKYSEAADIIKEVYNWNFYKFLRNLLNLYIEFQNIIQHSDIKNMQGIAETAKTNGPTCDNMCIQNM